MSLLKITLYGQTRPKKNSKQIVRIHGRPMVISSKRYMEWHKNAIDQLEKANVPKNKIDYEVEVKCKFYQEDRRPRDLSNMIESINDLLVDYEFLADDNRKIIKKLIITDGGVVGKEAARAEVEVNEWDGESY